LSICFFYGFGTSTSVSKSSFALLRMLARSNDFNITKGDIIILNQGVWFRRPGDETELTSIRAALKEFQVDIQSLHNSGIHLFWWETLAQHFKTKYHMFWSTTSGYKMWDPENDPSQCPRNGGGDYEPECCGGETTPFILFNTVNKKCCAGGKVVPDGQPCPQ